MPLGILPPKYVHALALYSFDLSRTIYNGLPLTSS